MKSSIDSYTTITLTLQKVHKEIVKLTHIKRLVWRALYDEQLMCIVKMYP